MDYWIILDGIAISVSLLAIYWVFEHNQQKTRLEILATDAVTFLNDIRLLSVIGSQQGDELAETTYRLNRSSSFIHLFWSWKTIQLFNEQMNVFYPEWQQPGDLDPLLSSFIDDVRGQMWIHKRKDDLLIPSISPK